MSSKGTAKWTSTQPSKIVGLLLCDEISMHAAQRFGDYSNLYADMLRDDKLNFKSWRVFDNCFPRSAHECDAWLISGSRSSAYDDDQWIETLREFLRSAYQAHVPIVGICFGHQVLAHALGGVVEKHNGSFVAGIRDYNFDGEDKPLSLIASHGDQVIQPPPSAATIASAPYCAHAALRYGQRAISFQPHPEFLPALMKTFIENGLVPPEDASDSLESLKRPVSSAHVALMIKNFLLSGSL